MTLELLISCVNKDTQALPEKMQLETDAVIVNQCDRAAYQSFMYEKHKIRVFHMEERGVGLSRNTALLHAKGDILLLADEDIVYQEGYAKQILDAFEAHPDMDMLLFNVDVVEDRATYHTTKETAIHWYNCGRYPAYSMALRRESLLRKNVFFSLLFGGGARYSNGEDSLFIWDCLKKGMKIKALPIRIGKEVPRPSTWFFGYTEKFFFDRGFLYQIMYARYAKPFALRFLYKNQKAMFSEKEAEVKNSKEAYALMKKGMEEAK